MLSRDPEALDDSVVSFDSFYSEDHSVVHQQYSSPASSTGERSDKSVIFIRNPDKSLGEGLRPGFEFPKRRIPTTQYDNDPIELYERHEGIFVMFLLSEFTLDIAVLAAQIVRPALVVSNPIGRLFPQLSPQQLYYSIAVIQLILFWGFYGSGYLAVSLKRQRWFNSFANVALLGLVWDALIVVLGSDGLAQFLLRAICLIYARYLQRLLIIGQLVPL